MTRTDVRRLALSLGAAALVTTGTGAQAPPNPPMAKKAPKTSTLHVVTCSDDYHWLRDKGSPEVTAYLEAENAYTAVGMKHTAALQETLFKELLGRIKEDDQAPPYRDGINLHWHDLQH
jgi:protease II